MTENAHRYDLTLTISVDATDEGEAVTKSANALAVLRQALLFDPACSMQVNTPVTKILTDEEKAATEAELTASQMSHLPEIMPGFFTSYNTSCHDYLSTDNVHEALTLDAWLIGNRKPLNDLINNYYGVYMENAYSTGISEIEEKLLDTTGGDHITNETRDAIRERLQELDDVDLEHDLIHNTQCWLTWHLPVTEDPSVDHAQAIVDAMKAVGYPMSLKDAVAFMENAPKTWDDETDVFLAWHGCPENGNLPDPESTRTVDVTGDLALAVIHTDSGSGWVDLVRPGGEDHEVCVTLPLSATSPIRIDDHPDHWSLDDIFGLVPQAFHADITDTETA